MRGSDYGKAALVGNALREHNDAIAKQKLRVERQAALAELVAERAERRGRGVEGPSDCYGISPAMVGFKVTMMRQRAR